jgi:dTDP-glucose 4,6-dehydratase/UDP-glucuronate decarboxylase
MKDLLARPDVSVIAQDVTEPVHPELKADFIVHAASRASPQNYLSAPLDTIDANVRATRGLLQNARDWDCESFLFFSSGEIYGNVPAEHTPTPETYLGAGDPMAARACYGESKRMGETLCATFHHQYETPVKVVRPFHVYGPGMSLDDGRIMAEFLRFRINNETIRGLGDGRGVRAFCYISDATAGFLAALLSDANGEAFNIGNDEEPVSIRQLAELMVGLEEPELGIEFADAKTDHLAGTPDRVCPDISKARRILEFAPEIGLRDGVLRTLDWHQAATKGLGP